MADSALLDGLMSCNARRRPAEAPLSLTLSHGGERESDAGARHWFSLTTSHSHLPTARTLSKPTSGYAVHDDPYPTVPFASVQPLLLGTAVSWSDSVDAHS